MDILEKLPKGLQPLYKKLMTSRNPREILETAVKMTIEEEMLPEEEKKRARELIEDGIPHGIQWRRETK